MESTLTKDQKKTFTDEWTNEHGQKCWLRATVRFDDECGNGHNSFAITGEISEGGHRSCGCIHGEIAKRFPQLAPLIKWHLCDSTGPMHYLANARYWAGGIPSCNKGGKWDSRSDGNTPPNAEHLKSTIVYGAVSSDLATDPMKLNFYDGAFDAWLAARLPALLEAFRRDVESLGFAW